MNNIDDCLTENVIIMRVIMKTNEIRSKFLDYFKQHEHNLLPVAH